MSKNKKGFTEKDKSRIMRKFQEKHGRSGNKGEFPAKVQSLVDKKKD
jgi:hypothetical protein